MKSRYWPWLACQTVAPEDLLLPQVFSDYVARLEDVLDLYAEGRTAEASGLLRL